MREIKFRAWDKNAKQILDWNEIGKILHTRYFDEWIADGGIILLQYTGLKDRNQWEIYEGDVLSHNTQEGIRWSVIKWDRVKAGFDFGAGWHHPGDGGIDCEVIGNIYENPELLK